MTQKRGRPVDEIAATRIGNDDEEMIKDGVEVRVSPQGGAYFWPARLRRGTPLQQSIAHRIQDRVRVNVTVLAQLDQLVDEGRSAGMSWDSIGWLTGMSGRGAQKRWGGDE